MFLLGLLCLAYYFLICFRLKRWNSTFSGFWVFAGLCFLLLGELKLRGAEYFLAGFGIVFFAVELRILFGMIPSRERELPYLIVLGAQVRGTKLSGSLYRRVEKARQYLSEHPETAVIVSGGQGKGEEITEAFAMWRYLTEHDIGGDRIFMEDSSTTTEENLRFSSKYIRDMRLPVGIVTNNFHMYRACRYAKRLGYQNPRSVPAGCNPYLFLNYMVREFFALMKMLLTKRKGMI